MSTYTLIRNETGELVREGITSDQLAQADRLLQASKRLGLHAAASNRANQRDRAVRYGNTYQHPEGVKKPKTYKRKPHESVRHVTTRRTVLQPVSLHGVMLDLVKSFFGAVWFTVGKF